MLARKQGGGGNGGSGGKSKVLYFKEDGATVATKYPIVDAGMYGIFVKISSEAPSYNELVGGLVGSTASLSTGTNGALMCYPILPDEEASDENMLTHAFLSDMAGEIGVEGGTVIMIAFKIAAFSLNATAAEGASALLGADISEGIWINATLVLERREDDIVEFALAYNAKEPEEEWIGDGNTHIWIELSEERKSPMLGLAVNGSAVVDWGDGTSPDVLTGTSSTPSDVLWTPKHEYSRGGEYVITLTVDGQAGIGGETNSNTGSYLLRNSAESDRCNIVYRNAIKRVEFGTGIVNVGAAGLAYCYDLRGVKLPESKLAFGSSCMYSCRNLEKFTMSNNDSPLGGGMFSGCEGLREVVFSESITAIPSSAFSGCAVLTYIKIPGKVSSVGVNAFSNCYSMKVCDFTDHSAVPTLNGTGAFNNVPEDCEIRVPAALAEAWKAATNWSTYADRIVGV